MTQKIWRISPYFFQLQGRTEFPKFSRPFLFKVFSYKKWTLRLLTMWHTLECPRKFSSRFPLEILVKLLSFTLDETLCQTTRNLLPRDLTNKYIENKKCEVLSVNFYICTFKVIAWIICLREIVILSYNKC